MDFVLELHFSEGFALGLLRRGGGSGGLSLDAFGGNWGWFLFFRQICLLFSVFLEVQDE